MTPRRLALAILLAAIAAAATTPGAASAGEYPVYACEPAFGDVNHSWFAESNNRKLTAYTACPVPWSETREWNQGLVTRSSVTTGYKDSVGYLSYALLRLRAPSGASLSRITHQDTFCGGDDFDAGLLNDAKQWLFASLAGTCGPVVRVPWTISLGGTRSVALMTICAKSSCQLNGALHAWATMRSATVWVADSTRPSVAITGGSLVARGWHRGTVSVAVSASDNVGIRHIDLFVDSKALLGESGTCDWTYTVPCTTPPGPLPVDSRGVADGAHSLVVKAEDSAGNWNSASRRVFVDNTAPAGPLDLRSSRGEAWSAANRFDVAWTNPPQTNTAPIAGVNAAICPASNAITDFRGCLRGAKKLSGIRSLTGLHVPVPGDWVGRFWLQDAAGNSDWRTEREIHLRYDGEAPIVSILDADPADPRRVAVAASDRLSGLASVEIEIRREGAASWLSLPVSTATGLFTAQVDDAVLPAGRYDLRVRVRDNAGNERTTTVRRSGAPATLNLPLRVPTSLALGGVRKVAGRHGRTRTVLRRRPTADFGDPVPVRGRLTLPGSNPLAGVDLEVFEQTALPGEAWRRIGIVRTDAHGQFSYKALPGPSRFIRFVYPGTSLIQPRTGTVHLRVRAATSFHVSRRRVVNGDEILFHGRVRGRLPKPGKLLQLQAYSRGTWRTFATPRAHPRSHRWRYRYRFSATRGIVRYRFRSVLPPEEGFPYLRGKSRQLGVTVRGL